MKIRGEAGGEADERRMGMKKGREDRSSEENANVSFYSSFLKGFAFFLASVRAQSERVGFGGRRRARRASASRQRVGAVPAG